VDKFTIIKPSVSELCDRAAHDLVHIAQQAVDERGEFNIALAGGTTPKHLYQLLAAPRFAKNFPWGKTHFFFGDERHSEPDSPESNYNMANTSLFKRVSIDPLRIHRIHGELEPADGAKAYDLVLGGLLPKTENGVVEFDLVLLGLGPDGHVASLFPDTDILQETDKRVAAVWVPQKQSWRISITIPVINNSRNVWIMVTGHSKQDIIDRVLNYTDVSGDLPVEMIKPKNGLLWYLDADAAALLK